MPNAKGSKTMPNVTSQTTPNPNAAVTNGNRAFIWYGLSVLAIVIDQLTKVVAVTKLGYEGASVPVLPFLNWTLLYNHGAAFSFLAGAGGWQRHFFTLLALVVAVVLVVWLRKLPRQATVLAAGLGLILGGALGNVIDRVRLGYVVDFIHVYYQSWHYPAFNIADSAITLGVIFILFDALFLEKKRRNG